MTSRFNWSNKVSKRHIQASEVKTHFLKLLDDVENGESMVVTRCGKIVAHIVPDEGERRMAVKEAIEKIKELRKSVKPVSLEEILAWRHEGHQY
jgi:antitoxin (DNA-binding transcriptional repressor) of toxin-antitoxin stability system